MIHIGRYRIGTAQFSMIIVFIVLSLCAIIAAFDQVRSERSMSLPVLIFINEGMALSATIAYGIIIHFISELIDRFSNPTN